MKVHISLCLLLLFIMAVNSRNFDEKIEREEVHETEEQADKRLRDHGANDFRHRRKRWQFSYGYNYPPPSYYDRRDDRYQQDLLPQIYALLDELSAYIKRPPPPPPQPIYIPYPVPYPVPQFQRCRCPGTGTSANVTVTERFPEMEDTNQNWGFVESGESADGGSDGTRPISFDPIPPIEVMKRPQPSVEHGSSQAGEELTTRNPFSVRGTSQSSRARSPSRCDGAVLSCCGYSTSLEQKNCFINVGCEAYFNKENVCTPQNQARVIELFTQAYSVGK